MSNNKTNFYVDWCAGPSVQIELLSPIDKEEGGYMMNYTSSFRGTIRPPFAELKVGPNALNPIKERMNDIVGKKIGLTRGNGTTPPAPAPDSEIFDDMKLLGEQLYTFLIQQYLRADMDLRQPELYLEIGMDDDLMNFPWEMIYDGDNFLCLKQYIGRFVRSKEPQPDLMNPSTTLGSSLENLSILLISVPKTDENKETKDFEPLPQAEEEKKAILQTLGGIENVTPKIIEPKDATFDGVYKALRRETYDILHFCGHAYYDDKHPANSGIVLRDKIMRTGQIASTIRARNDRMTPVLCFVNACETTKEVDIDAEKVKGGNQLNIYGLGRAFLDTGAYLLGSRWPVNDTTAKKFAGEFYKFLLKDEQSIGQAVCSARNACKKNASDIFGWATYIYYGDPRIYFRKAS
ncbi:CHAT domain-containing protein [Candidatus Bathyarchaeota archaeon]|nr:CHAT domain-containing protein [Candidatus Bathyarchaeota archaeon]